MGFRFGSDCKRMLEMSLKKIASSTADAPRHPAVAPTGQQAKLAQRGRQSGPSVSCGARCNVSAQRYQSFAGQIKLGSTGF